MRNLSLAAIAALCLLGGQANAKDITPKNAQEALVAGMMAGMCDAWGQPASTVSMSGVTEVKPAHAEMSFEEKRRCAYVKSGVKQGCFMNGTCPSYEDWVKTYVPGHESK